ncbi:MAG: T9SS type A sorting domain-containing protein [Bacteroidetes bacterium]|nr:T9SS type A sorting domain-containing protein [Bacteroidota bacterium]
MRFKLFRPAYVKLLIYDMLGREVARLADEQMPAGYHGVTWSANGMASGVYIYKLSAGSFVQVKRMILMK